LSEANTHQNGENSPNLGRCYDFNSIFAKKLANNICVFAQTAASFCKNVIITLVFEKKRQFLPKIGKNSRLNVFASFLGFSFP
jgi:hypothetical protein